MATYTLVPNEDHSPDAGTWSLSTGSDIFDVLNQSLQYVHHNTTAQDFRVGFLSQVLDTGETIDSIQACITAHTGNTRSDTAVVLVAVEKGNNADYFTDNHTVTENGGSPATYCSQAKTVNPATSAAWDQGAIDALRMDVEITSFSGGSPTVVLYEAYITVVTTIPPSQTTYTSDDQVILDGGTLEFKNGMTVIGSKS